MCQGGCKGDCGCNVTTITKGQKGDQGSIGPQGPTGVGSAVTVKDAQGNVVSNSTEIRFTDANATVTNLTGGVAQVNFIPAATIWNDVLGLSYYTGGSESFKPQYTIEGNRITFRGMLFVPLNGGPLISNGNAYLPVAGATLDETKMQIIGNSNNNNGGPQGRIFTTNVVSTPNLPLSKWPVARDIVFNNVPCYRRYLGSAVAVYRSVVDIRIGSTTTVFTDGTTNLAKGCIMIFSPFNTEYAGDGTGPLGNDPLALGISRVTASSLGANYIASTDDNPFTVGSTTQLSAFSVNAHNITSLGGFIINLEGLSGYIN